MARMFRECLQAAADICSPDGDGDYLNLNPSLCDQLEAIDDLCRRASGTLHSRQIVSTLVWMWQTQHPTQRAYRETPDQAWSTDV